MNVTRPTIKVGQVYASKRSVDFLLDIRQRRRVVEVDLAGPFVYLLTVDGSANRRPSRVRLRSARSFTIPGYRLVEDVPS